LSKLERNTKGNLRRAEEKKKKSLPLDTDGKKSKHQGEGNREASSSFGEGRVRGKGGRIRKTGGGRPLLLERNPSEEYSMHHLLKPEKRRKGGEMKGPSLSSREKGNSFLSVRKSGFKRLGAPEQRERRRRVVPRQSGEGEGLTCDPVRVTRSILTRQERGRGPETSGKE